VFFGVEVDAAEFGLQFLRAGLGEMDIAAVGVGVVVLACDQLADQPDDLDLWHLAVGGAREDKGHQRFVDEHRVGLIDQRHVGVGRHQIVDVGDQLVAQDVEADLVDRGVGDIALVRLAPLLGRRLGGDPADRQPHRLDQRAHPFGVAAGQVIVDGDDVHVAPAARVAGRRDRTRQRLTFTSRHLNHVAGQHPLRAMQLDVERLQRGGPLGRLAGDRQELRDVRRFGQIVEVQQLRGLAQLLVVKVGGLLVELRRVAHLRHRPGLILVGAGAEQLPEPVADTT